MKTRLCEGRLNYLGTSDGDDTTGGCCLRISAQILMFKDLVSKAWTSVQRPILKVQYTKTHIKGLELKDQFVLMTWRRKVSFMCQWNSARTCDQGLVLFKGLAFKVQC